MVDGFVQAEGYLFSLTLRSQRWKVALPMIVRFGLGLANLCAKSLDPCPPWLMFSKAVAKCWVCPAEFARRRKLKNHLAAAPHLRLRVVCVWCTDEEKVFRRMVDLKQHVMQLHPKVVDDAPTDFFGEGNGFWMALHPNDYNQIVGATPKESSAAVQARVRLLIWVGKCPNTSRSRIEWQRGWEFIYSSRARRSLEVPSLHVQHLLYPEKVHLRRRLCQIMMMRSMA
ncbi:hypothetical protein CHS0354_021185 [Potamilus streckersoni]|uniref:C2H2-type domain-containing protein n=1 Tax=Potamilus streckersoni TaxID=2493646 RepID=A0AAE0WAQ2_9BIVA|nr:hypothetical protein CHS0354_021185 [Potamilus streckersoni]